MSVAAKLQLQIETLVTIKRTRINKFNWFCSYSPQRFFQKKLSGSHCLPLPHVLQNHLSFISVMTNITHAENQIHFVDNFQDLVNTPFKGILNAICWDRKLVGDFSEIVKKVALTGNITEIEEDELLALHLSENGQLAREILLNDLNALRAHGASPVLNVIKNYDRDNTYPFFATDVYSFHVDRSPVPTDTFLCTYYGDSSEILPNSQGIKKVLVPEIRDQLKKLFQGAEEDFESFLTENFFDLHYQAKPDAHPISLGLGNLWRLAVDHPDSLVLPCLHRAPMEKSGQSRLLLIC